MQIVPDKRAGKPDRVVFIGEYRFPYGDAAAIRTMSLAKICRDLGYRTVVIGKGDYRCVDRDPESGRYYVEGIQYLTMNPEKVTLSVRILQLQSRLRQFTEALSEVNVSDDDVVIINACDSARHIPFVYHYCKRNSIPLIADVCEWYDPAHRKFGRANPFYIAFAIAFHCYLPRFKSMIVVSTLLYKRFQPHVKFIVRVPAPVDLQLLNGGESRCGSKLVLLYAGSPGKKDLLREVVEGLGLIPEDARARIELRIIGVTLEQLRGIVGPDRLNRVASNIIVFGRMPQASVLQHLNLSHFSILLRDDRRFANAGFPSKVAESLACGVPMILNYTSDLQEFLGAEEACIRISDSGPQSFARGVERALAMSEAELLDFRRAALAVAKKHFDYKVYSQAIDQLLCSAN